MTSQSYEREMSSEDLPVQSVVADGANEKFALRTTSVSAVGHDGHAVHKLPFIEIP